MSKKYLVVGAGLTGAVIARELAEAGHRVTVLEERKHLAGHCHTAWDEFTGVLVHRFGPHVFHTDDSVVWKYVQRFAPFESYRLQVRARTGRGVFSLPINLQTINQFFGRDLNPEEASKHLAWVREDIPHPQNFEQAALATVGRQLYEEFFRGYTEKMWGRPASDIPASVFGRLPVRFDYNDNYFNHRYQGIPRYGYTEMVRQMLGSPNIRVELGAEFTHDLTAAFDHVFYTGPIDRFFKHRLGRLPYRSLKFHTWRSHNQPLVGCAVMNRPSAEIRFTRSVEHRYLSPWQQTAGSVVTFEYPFETGAQDTPFYPVRLAEGNELIARYEALALAEDRVTFAGRLGTYKYLDMDQAVRQALDIAAARLQISTHGFPRD